MRIRLVSVAASTIVAVQIMGLFLPNVHEVRDRRHGSIDPEDLSRTLWVAAMVAFMVGVMVAVAARNPLPVVSALAAVGVVVGIYQWALRNPIGA